MAGSDLRNPFAEGESRIVRPPSTGMIIFGATGDLTARKLLPALYNLADDDYLPARFFVLGVSRSKLSDQEFRERIKQGIEQYSRQELNPDLWAKFAENIFYQSMDAAVASEFTGLRKRLEDLCKARYGDCNYVYYLATDPRLFADIAGHLRSVDLVSYRDTDIRRTSLVIEKPFGHDLQSARELNGKLLNSFSESQIYRIDHYLGKETVQNILVFRFANGIFEPLWNRNHVDHIEITVAEDIGVSNRGAYFDSAGITRDIVQNHLLQMLSLICIEPPQSLSHADSIRDEKVKVLRSVRRVHPSEVEKYSVRAQYTSGHVVGMPVKGYLEESGVSKTSSTETFVALQLEVDNWRWAGVPIYVRAGKRLPKRITEILIVFKQPPKMMFQGRQVPELQPNTLSIQVQPNESISLRMNAKPPGPRLRVGPVHMEFEYDESFTTPSPEAYERLLLDVMRGDATLFTRKDEIEEAWDLLAPFLNHWAQSKESLLNYPAGSWGPLESFRLLERNKRSWRTL